VSTYEIVAVVRPDLDEEELGAAIGRVHQRIAEYGGTVKTSERWGKRKTAYTIQKYRDGYYVLTVFTLDAGQVARLRQTLGLHEDLLRFTVATHHPSPTRAGAQPAASAPAPGSTAAPSTAPQPSPAVTSASATASAPPAAEGAPPASLPEG